MSKIPRASANSIVIIYFFLLYHNPPMYLISYGPEATYPLFSFVYFVSESLSLPAANNLGKEKSRALYERVRVISSYHLDFSRIKKDIIETRRRVECEKKNSMENNIKKAIMNLKRQQTYREGNKFDTHTKKILLRLRVGNEKRLKK